MLVAVVNNKGGVGKSTLAVHVAVWLHEHGLRVVVLDADVHRSATAWLSRAAPQVPVERYTEPGEILARGAHMQSATDVVLADGPAGRMAATAALIALADRVLLPLGPSPLDVSASAATARLIERIRSHPKRNGLPEVVTVLNRVQPRTRLAHAAAAAARDYGFPVAATVLHLRQAYADACGQGSVVWRMGSGARPAADEIARLFGEVLDVPDGLAARPARAAQVPGADGRVVRRRARAGPAPLPGRRSSPHIS